MQGGGEKEREIQSSTEFRSMHSVQLYIVPMQHQFLSSYVFIFVLANTIIQSNILFIKVSIICLGAPLLSLSSAELCFHSAAVSSFRQLFTQSATKLALNMAIRWHTAHCNRHNQSNTDAISNFIAPFQSFSLSHFHPPPFISALICSPPHDHNPSSSIGTRSMKGKRN